MHTVFPSGLCMQGLLRQGSTGQFTSSINGQSSSHSKIEKKIKTKQNESLNLSDQKSEITDGNFGMKPLD